ncbi:MAG TPA: hypothetical protein VJR02_29555 [Pyrinomonadaceae bacterium]|nr:hypothetical protein [Pyrinomonadaceae bacterium]
MRKFISIVVALVVGVSAGLGSSEMWVCARVLPYCTVAKNADAYHLRFVRVKATVEFRDDGATIYQDCDSDEALGTFIDFEDGAQPAVSTGLIFSDTSQIKTVDAIVEGEFESDFSLGCYGPKFVIRASKFEVTSPTETRSRW